MSTADGQEIPEQIRAEIDATRAGLSYDVDTLADKVDPSSIAHRQEHDLTSQAKEKAAPAAQQSKDAVQGA